LKLYKRFYRSLILPIFAILRKVSLPGCEGVSVYHVLRFIYKEALKDDITTRANSIAFTFFLSLFPAIIFVFTLIPLLPIRFDLISAISGIEQKALPSEAFTYLKEIIESVVSIKRGGLLSLGFFFALFFSSNGMVTLMSGFDKSYHHLTFKKRRALKKRGIAIGLTLIITFIFILSFVFIVFGDKLLIEISDWFNLGDASSTFIHIFRWFVALVLIYTSISLIYRYGPSMYRKFRFFSVGATLATLLSIISSLGFAYFINNFGQYNELYGSIGALIVLLLWLDINAIILLLGFELNASVAVERDRYVYQSKKKSSLISV